MSDPARFVRVGAKILLPEPTGAGKGQSLTGEVPIGGYS